MDFRIYAACTILRAPLKSGSFTYGELLSDEIVYLWGTNTEFADSVHSYAGKLSELSNKRVRCLKQAIKEVPQDAIDYWWPSHPAIEPTDAKLELLRASIWGNLDVKGFIPPRGVFFWKSFYSDEAVMMFPNSSKIEYLDMCIGVMKDFISDLLKEGPKSWDSRYDWVDYLYNEDGSVSRDYSDLIEEYEGDVEEVMQEIADRLNLLRSHGVSEMAIRALFENHRELSRLVVTADFRIILPDYNNMEIKMEPLPKSLWLLYLRHPEGLRFKDLQDYRAEFLRIYSAVTRRNDLTAVMESIDRLLDPTHNAINENCSRIKAAFISQFDDGLARHYYIARDEKRYKVPLAKGISLDRSLVSQEYEL